MRYYVIAGEASGDLHGSYLLNAIREEDPDAEFRVWGGDMMSAQGATLVKHYRDLAFMGFAEVVRNLRTILRNMDFCKKDILEFQPDALILIDYPGFNLRIAKWAKKQGLRVFYYISPQIWAWHSSRVHGIKKTVDRMYVILPFEQAFYARYGYEVEFVGHPLLDVVAQTPPRPDFRQANALDERPIIALLPGSRRQEISRILPVMLEVIPHFPEYQFVLACAPAIPEAFYQTIIQSAGNAAPKLIQGQTYAVLQHAHAALVTSGTATLETALFGVPEVVCYKGGKISFLIARQVVNVPFISLVNLILDQPLLKELIQHLCTPEAVRQELRQILQGPGREAILEGYGRLRGALGNSGAAQRAAKSMVRFCMHQ